MLCFLNIIFLNYKISVLRILFLFLTPHDFISHFFAKLLKIRIYGDILICCSNANADAVGIFFISQVEIQGIGTYEGTFTATISEEAYRFCLQKVCVLCQPVPLSKVKY